MCSISVSECSEYKVDIISDASDPVPSSDNTALCVKIIIYQKQK